ncbi:MAG: flotillin family protein [Candidatus Melainabacteria bacterium]|nr:flotillin family protein [Candidatus Melainabacteria bacterium]
MSLEILILGGLAVFMLFALGWLMAGFYQKCGPNEAMIVSGFGASEEDRKYKIVVGGGAVVLPVIQQRAFLSLEIMPIEVRSSAPIITRNGVPIFVECVAQVKVKGDNISIATAAEQFLGKSDEEIASIAHETLVGHLRAMLGTMEVEELIQSFEKFAQRAQEVSQYDLAKMGLTVVSFTIKEVKDNVGYLEALGRKRTADAKRDADIGVAEATSAAQIKQAQAQSNAQMAQSEAQRNAQIVAAEKQSEAQIAQAEFQRKAQIVQAQEEIAIKKASADLAYDITKAQSQQKLIEEQQQIKIIEIQKQVEIQTVEVQRRQVSLEAEITKTAEAEQTRVRLLAQAQADAAKLQAQGEADAIKLKALANAEATKLLGQAQAEAERAKGLAEASIIAAKGQAEAEAMTKKAEAFKQYNNAAMASMIIERLPDIVTASASPLSKIGQMTVLSTGGDSIGASKITGDILNVAAQSLTMVKGLTGIDLTATLRRDNQPVEESVTTRRGV